MTRRFERAMRAHIARAWLLLLCVLAIVGITSRVSAKPVNVPIKVEYNAPAPAKVGEEVTTVLKFRALLDLDRLEVTVAPYKGLELKSEPAKVTFTDIKRGEARTFTVTVRLTEEPFGYLSVTYQTQQGTIRAAGAMVVVYPTASPAE